MTGALVALAGLLWLAGGLLGALVVLLVIVPAGLPPPRPDQGYAPGGTPMAPGSQNVVRARLVLIFGPTGSITGLFMYAAGTTPGAGNQPILAVTNQSTDPFGNPIPAPGVTVFASANQWANLNNAVLSFNAAAGQASQAGIASNAAGQLVLESGEVSAGDSQAEIGMLSSDANGGGGSLIELIATSTLLNSEASSATPGPAPSITGLGSTWNATTASQCNTNFGNIISALMAIGAIQ